MPSRHPCQQAGRASSSGICGLGSQRAGGRRDPGTQGPGVGRGWVPGYPGYPGYCTRDTPASARSLPDAAARRQGGPLARLRGKFRITSASGSVTYRQRNPYSVDYCPSGLRGNRRRRYLLLLHLWADAQRIRPPRGTSPRGSSLRDATR